MKLIGAILVVLLAALPASAQRDDVEPQPRVKAKPPIPKRVPPPPPPPPGRDLPLAERIEIQLGLAWSGDFSGLIDGDFDEKTIAAVKAFQRNNKFKETGLLNAQERALLAAAVKAKQSQVGWTVIDDAVTGARLGVPIRQAPNKAAGASGTRWSSAQGQVQIETFRIREPGTTLALVHEQQRKDPSTRKVWVNVLRPDFFVLAGMQGLKKFHVRAAIKDGEVRGMTVLYDQATDTIMDAVAVAMAGTFSAFPGVAGASHFGPPGRRKVEYATGIVVSAAGHILTDRRAVDGCNVIAVSSHGDAERQAEDQATELALLRVYGAFDLAAAAFASEPPRAPDVTLMGIADPQAQGGGGAVSTVAAKLKGNVADPAPQPGFAGAAALDSRGSVIGMLVGLGNPMVADASAATPQPLAIVVPAPAIRAFLERHKLAPASGRSGLDAAKASLVRVICVRK